MRDALSVATLAYALSPEGDRSTKLVQQIRTYERRLAEASSARTAAPPAIIAPASSSSPSRGKPSRPPRPASSAGR